MRSRSSTFLVVLALLAPAFAGCLGSGALGPASAKSSFGAAQDAAAKLLTGGHLVGVQGFEPFHHLVDRYDGNITGEVTLHGDSTIGDGNAPLWVFAYRNATREAQVVILGSDHVLATGWNVLGFQAGTAQPITNWTVDSVDAAELLAHDARWPTPRENTTVIWSLAEGTGQPVWNVTQIQDLNYARNVTYAWVGAANGTVLRVGHYSYGFGVIGLHQNETVYGNGTLGPHVDVSTQMTVAFPGSKLLAEATLNASQLASLHGPVTLEIQTLNGTIIAQQRYDDQAAGVVQVTANMGTASDWVQAVLTTSQDVRTVQVQLTVRS